MLMARPLCRWMIPFVFLAFGALVYVPISMASADGNGAAGDNGERPDEPDTPGDLVEPAPAPSRLAVVAWADADVIREHLEETVPQGRARPDTFRQNGPGGAEGGLRASIENYEYRYWFERGPFRVEAIDNGLRIYSRLNVHVDVRARLTRAAPLRSAQLRDRRMDFGVDIGAAVDEDWSLRPNLYRIHVHLLDLANLRIGQTQIANLTRFLEGELRQMAAASRRRLEALLTNSVDLPALVQAAWTGVLARSHRLDVEGDEAQWHFRPISLAAGRARGVDGRLRLDLELDCDPLLSFGPVPFEATELPHNSAAGASAGDAPPFHIMAEILLPLENLSHRISESLANDPEAWSWEDRGTEVSLSAVEMTMRDDNLVTRLSLEIRRPGPRDRQGSVMRRDVHVAGTPALSDDGNELSLTNLHTVDVPPDLLSRTLANRVLTQVREHAVFNIGPELVRLHARVTAAMNRTYDVDERFEVVMTGTLDAPVRLHDWSVVAVPQAAAGRDEEVDEGNDDDDVAEEPADDGAKEEEVAGGQPGAANGNGVEDADEVTEAAEPVPSIRLVFELRGRVEATLVTR